MACAVLLAGDPRAVGVWLNCAAISRAAHVDGRQLHTIANGLGVDELACLLVHRTVTHLLGKCGRTVATTATASTASLGRARRRTRRRGARAWTSRCRVAQGCLVPNTSTRCEELQGGLGIATDLQAGEAFFTLILLQAPTGIIIAPTSGAFRHRTRNNVIHIVVGDVLLAVVVTCEVDVRPMPAHNRVQLLLHRTTAAMVAC